MSDRPRHTTSVYLPRDTLVTLYTDGLVECRTDDIDNGLRKLCGVLDTVVTYPAEWVCAEIMTILIGTRYVDDDVSLLVFKRS